MSTEQETYLVKHVRTGRYLSVANCGGKSALVTLQWGPMAEAWPVPLEAARSLSAAHIAVTKDRDVEIVNAYGEAS